MPRKTKQLSIDDNNFKNTDGTKTRIELLPSGRVVPYKKELWKASTIKLFSNITKKKYGKMQTKKKTPKKKPKNKTVKKALTKRKSVLKDLKTISRLRSYSPSINKEIERLSISPHKNLIGPCNDKQIFVPKKGAKPDVDGWLDGKCTSWTAKSTQKYLLDNLKSKKPIIPTNIRGPFQNRSNCWFNTFFMMFFISDKGRKFMKAFRESMITGKFKTTGTKIPPGIRYPFWLLNKMITAVLVGSKDPEEYWSYMDTNKVINEIYKQLKIYNKKEMVGFREIIKPGDSGNPITMFLAITNYFDNKLGSGFGVTTLNIHKYRDFISLNTRGSKSYTWVESNKPHIIIIQITDKLDDEKGDTKWHGKIPGKNKYAQVKDFKKKLKYKIGDMEYTLDSMGIRDNNQQHICALITLNKKEYMFDGENNMTTQREDWKKLLNKNKNFKITQRIPETYNLTKGYQCLLYYRSK